MLSETLSRQAKELSRREFVEHYRECFLVYGLTAPPKRTVDFKTGNYPVLPRTTPSPFPAATAAPHAAPPPAGYASTMRVSVMTAMQAVQAVQASARGESREQTGVLMVAKTDRNPYSDRISVGRAASCDLVMPVMLVSKLHAHFLRPASGEPGWEMRDADSTNGTWVNGVRAPSGKRVPVRAGDTLRLAFCEARFVDAAGLFDWFQSTLSGPTAAGR